MIRECVQMYTFASAAICPRNHTFRRVFGRFFVFGSQAVEQVVHLAAPRRIAGIVVNAPQLVRVVFEVEQLPIVELRLVKVDELVAIGDGAVLPGDVVRPGMLVIVVVKAFAPIMPAFGL